MTEGFRHFYSFYKWCPLNVKIKIFANLSTLSDLDLVLNKTSYLIIKFIPLFVYYILKKNERTTLIYLLALLILLFINIKVFGDNKILDKYYTAVSIYL